MPPPHKFVLLLALAGLLTGICALDEQVRYGGDRDDVYMDLEERRLLKRRQVFEMIWRVADALNAIGIRWPTHAEQAVSAAHFASKQPLFQDAFGAVDGSHVLVRENQVCHSLTPSLTYTHAHTHTCLPLSRSLTHAHNTHFARSLAPSLLLSLTHP